MKKVFFALLCFVCLSANAQTADEVLQHYAANLGGLEAFQKIKTAKMTGTFTVQGNELSISLQIVNGKALRKVITVMDNSIITVYKDEKGWQQNPLKGTAAPQDLTERELAEARSESFIAPVLMDYKARGYKAEMQGQEEIEGKKAFTIKLANENGKITTYHINAADYTLIKSVSEQNLMGQIRMVEQWPGDPQKIDGLTFYKTMTIKVEGQEPTTIKFDNIELNIPIDEKTFDKP